MRASFILIVGLLIPASAAGQQPLARADFVASIGSFGANHRDVSDRDQWTHDWFRGLGAGVYWTEHLKAEIEVAWTGRSEVYGVEDLRIAGLPFARVYSEHRFQYFKTSIAQTYQFGRNAWAHPYLGAGVDLDRERHEIERAQQTISGIRVPALDQTTTTLRARPFVRGGLKAYFSERGFFRGEVHVGVGSRPQVIWKAGLGFDF